MSASPSEFDLIARYFTRATPSAVLGVGDDAAIVVPRPGMQLLMSTDMLAAGTHFFNDAEPEALGWKALAVNISDLAAMGAMPRWALLAMALPKMDSAADEAWIAAFACGFFACATQFNVDVIGGDTTRGPMNFCATILGETPVGQALLRSGAKAGDDIWISGSPGCAALGLAYLRGKCALAPAMLAKCLAALHRPQPRVALGLALRGIASAAIDVSDGFLADLGHILDASGVSAEIEIERMPSLDDENVDADLLRDCLLAGGDDYELAFTAPAAHRLTIDALTKSLSLPLTRIGHLVPRRPERIRVLTADGGAIVAGRTGYDHFR